MSDLNIPQMVVSVLLSGGFVGGLFALLTKSMWSPESKNDLARLGNDFARQLLADAQTERAELRLTIHELETNKTAHLETIERLKNLLNEKNRVIRELEERLTRMAEKLSAGEAISLRDIFGENAPDHTYYSPDEAV